MTLLQAGPQGLSQALPVTLLYLLLIVAFFYFFMIRPQQVQGRRRREMLAKLKKGDRVVTLGGLHATIHDVNSDHLTLELAPNVRVKADHSAVHAVRGRKDKE